MQLRLPLPGRTSVSLWTFIRALYKRIDAHQTFSSAAELAYYFIFSIFPFLLFLAALTPFLPLKAPLLELVQRARAFLPPVAVDVLERQVTDLVHNPHTGLLTLGLLVTIYAASRGIQAMRRALNRAFAVEETRPFWQLVPLSMVATVCGGVFVLVSLAVIAVGGSFGAWVFEQLSLDMADYVWWTMLRPLTLTPMFFVGVLAMYRVLPAKRQRLRTLLPGTVFTIITWLFATWGFSIYVENFNSYNAMYGSIGTVMILLLWLYVIGLTIVVGGEVNAVITELASEQPRAGSKPSTRQPKSEGAAPRPERSA